VTDQQVNHSGMTRRQLLRCSALAGAGGLLGLGVSAAWASPRKRLELRETDPWHSASLEFALTPGTEQVLPGAPTTVWRYGVTVRQGPTEMVRPVGSWLGPIVRAKRGQTLRIRTINNLDEPTITHYHGLDVPEEVDGHPRLAFGPGQSQDVVFSVLNRAGTYWYHPHPDMRTGAQVNMGLAGLFIVEDDEEQALGLPRGERDIPLVIQDRRFDVDNQFLYNADMVNGFLGTNIFVNGVQNLSRQVGTRVLRLRVLNGSASRIYKLQFAGGSAPVPMVVIGNDGGLLAEPRTYPYVMLAPGERVELWVDLRNQAVGSSVTLRSVTFAGAGSGQGSSNINLVRFDVSRQEPESLTLPSVLSRIEAYRLQDAVNASSPRTYPISFMSGMGYHLNNAMFEMEATAPNEVVPAGALEVVDVVNPALPVPRSTAHPMHWHGRQFQILSRTMNGAGAYLTNYNTVKDGLVDAGWKDTFLIMPGETVRFLMRWTDYKGLFLYHCHNLPHEDMGMMRNYRTV
jgi:FtsP/CotA-like multicopper oxidase with cupredoxin domain